jgi:hypothetical protein
MSNNCLVTKLKGSVQNDNLPRFNEMLFDYVGRTDSVSSASSIMLMTTAEAKALSIKSAVDMYINTISGAPVREYTLAPGAYVQILNSKENLGANPIPNLIDIVGGSIYDLCKLSVGYGIDPFKVKTKMASLFEYGSLYAYGLYITGYHDLSILPNCDGLEYLLLGVDNTNDVSYNVDLSDLTSKFPSIKVLCITNGNVLYSVIINNLPEGIEYVCGGRNKGNTSKLPSSLKGVTGVFFNTGLCTGALEDFVAKARLAGRTTGWLLIQKSPFSATVVTYNGTNFGTYVTNTPPPTVHVGNNDYYMLTWTSDSIGWGDTAPEDAIDVVSMISVYRYNKQ